MKQSYVTVTPCIVKVKIITTGNTDNAFDCCRVERQKIADIDAARRARGAGSM